MLAFTVCGRQAEECVTADVLPKGPFPVERNGELVKHPLNYLLAVEEWGWLDSVIVCKSPGTGMPFYCLDPATWTVVDSIGKIGPGPGELIAPHFIAGARRRMIADNGRRELVWYEGGRIAGKTGLKTGAPVNFPSFYADSLICFIENYPDELVWRLYNYVTGREAVHVAFQDKEKKGKAEQYDFTYATGKNYLAIARLYSNQVLIYDLKDGKAELRHTIRGKTDDGRFYYSAVVRSGDKIYLLNQENVDPAAETGRSRVEVFSLDGRPLECITIPLIADRFLVDGKRGRILFLSPFDDEFIYTLSL